VGRGRARPKPLKYLRQLVLKHLELADLLPHPAQLLRHKELQSGTQGSTLLAFNLSRQHFEMGKGKP
jgi:hypothetical protein